MNGAGQESPKGTAEHEQQQMMEDQELLELLQQLDSFNPAVIYRLKH